ncbi:MAG: magnesium transporter [Clostridia bacterium]|nr:magnesium transporter [Clostridia bacterium]
MLTQIQDLLAARKFAQIHALLAEMNPADVATLFADLEEKDLPLLYRLLPKELAAEVFVYMDNDMQELLIRSFSDKELKEIIDDLFLDDTVDLVEEMPANVVSRILRSANPSTRKMINELLKYPEDSAGSLMTIEYVYFQKNITVRDAIARLRKVGVDKETIYTCYVTQDRELIGLVSVKDLLLASDDTILEDIMETNVIYVDAYEDKETVANIFSKYDFIALPVVDKERRLVGIITVDDAMDVMQQEATEDIEKMAAITPTDKSYMHTGVWETWGKRIPWLMLLMISATFTGMIITGFEQRLAHCVVLTAFIPMLMDTAGNCGSQASVTVIRALSLNDIDFRDTFRVLWKESRVALLCGVALAIANFGKMMLIDRLLLSNDSVTPWIALVVCLTLIVTVLFAKIVGCTLPILAKRIGFDPAVMASPFITTIVDALSLLVYFRVASTILPL